ncbi:hypothetical protein [Arenibacter amylolyticus]|uniref:hypothetical protein n=1 Tax=Arenibacter amylolyticus TaxID=1406873 RepID=UPI000A3BAEC7|nr:hypothetical protein [Arenibacter amylolyticus]
MKKLVIGIMLFGIASLGYSQKVKQMFEEVTLTGVTVSPIINSEYLQKVQDGSTPLPAKILENAVARYNVKDSEVYEDNIDGYIVEFKQNGGRVIATFNGKGNIVDAYEVYENVRLPHPVLVDISRNHSGWIANYSKYIVAYERSKNVRKMFKIRLGKDGNRKTMKVHMSM